MSFIINASPGQFVTLFLETKDGYSRADAYSGPPIISQIIFPNMSLASGYPKPMVRVSQGLYTFGFTLPMMASAVGSYLVDVSWMDGATQSFSQTFFQVICTAPFGQYSITAG